MTRLLTAAALIAALTVPAVATTESCAIVRKTPDGFLNMRYQPKMGAVIVGRLKPGEHVLVHDETVPPQALYDETVPPQALYDETVPPQSRGKWARLALGNYKFAYVRTRYLHLGACERGDR
jgi:hypothetical protein